MAYLSSQRGWSLGRERPYRQKREGNKIWFHDSWSMIATFPLITHIYRNEGYSLRKIIFLANLTLGLPCNLFPTLLLINYLTFPHYYEKIESQIRNLPVPWEITFDSQFTLLISTIIVTLALRIILNKKLSSKCSLCHNASDKEHILCCVGITTK